MADEKKDTKESPLKLFKAKLGNKAKVQEAITEGLKSTNSKVRSLAIKYAYKTQEHPFVKKHVLPLLESEKSKKVLRTLSNKVTRKELQEKVKKLISEKIVLKKKEKAEPAAEAAPKEG